LAVRARAWFIEAWHSPLWTKYRQESTEDLGYYRGGAGQWSKDGSDADLKALTSANRAAVSINHVQSIVDVLTGFERQNRFDPKVQAQGEEDEDDARLMTWLLKFVREQANAAAVESTAFEDGVISGMAAVNVRVDWTEDPHNGTIQLERLTPGVDVMWDPAWTKDDLSDAENSVLNAHTLQNVQDQSPVFYKTGHQPPAWYYPQALADLFRLLTTESDRMQVAMRRISGINVDILGLREKGDPSGIAIARTQAQGQVIATVFFDNYRAFKRHVNERLARRVQQVFTSERTFRLTNELGERVSVKVNPVDAKGKTRDEYARLQASDQKTDRARVLRNLQEFLTYDVVISDAPATPTMRSMQLFGLLEVLRTLPNLPAAAPTFLIKVVELLDIEGKGEILAELRRTLGGAGAIQPPAGPMSTGGGQVEAGQGLATGGVPPAAVPTPATQGRAA